MSSATQQQTSVCLKAFADNSISNPSPGVLSVTPTTGLSATGNAGGPFSPASQTYTLTNTGQSGINWTASATTSWVGLSPKSGTLAGRGQHDRCGIHQLCG